MLVERGAQRAHAAVHHVARRDRVGARLGLGDRGAREQLERLVVVDDAVGAQHAAVAVRGVLAQAEVGDDQQVRVGGLDRARGELDHALVVPRARALLVLARPGRPNSSTAGMPSACAIPASSTAPSIETWSMPGISAIGVRLRAGRHDEHRVDEVRHRRARSRGRGRAARRSSAGGAGGWRERPSRASLEPAESQRVRSPPYAAASASRCTRRAPSPSSARSVGLNGERAGDDVERVVEARVDRAGRDQGEERERQREQDRQQRGDPHLARERAQRGAERGERQRARRQRERLELERRRRSG